MKSQKDKNLIAFLSMIACSEGTKNKGEDDGYDVLVGGGTFESYDKHPNVKVELKRKGKDSIFSTAAGRYQILYNMWEDYAAKGRLDLFDKERYPDGAFGKCAQDAIAEQFIKECNAYVTAREGQIVEAVTRCRSRWASLPGADYGQHEQSYKYLIQKFIEFGGIVVPI